MLIEDKGWLHASAFGVDVAGDRFGSVRVRKPEHLTKCRSCVKLIAVSSLK